MNTKDFNAGVEAAYKLATEWSMKTVGEESLTAKILAREIAELKKGQELPTALGSCSEKARAEFARIGALPLGRDEIMREMMAAVFDEKMRQRDQRRVDELNQHDPSRPYVLRP